MNTTIADLKALAEKATARPWQPTWDEDDASGTQFICGIEADGVGTIADAWSSTADGELILAAVNVLPDLIAAVEAAWGIAANAQPIRETSLTQIARGEPGKVVRWVVDCDVIEANRRALAPLYRPQGPAGGEEAG